MGTYLPGNGTLGWVVWCGAGIPHSQSIPPDFYLPHMGVGPPIPSLLTSPPLLPICMNVTSLIPWLLDFHTPQFSGNSG